MRASGLSLALAGLSVAASPQTPPTGDWVAQQVEARDTGKDGHHQMEMRIYDRRGRETVRKLASWSRREDGLDRVLVRFSFPGDIKDTAFLSVENRTGEDDRFLYLPSLGRSRRISAQEGQESFVGSDLSYEDVSGRRLEDYDYKFLREEPADDRRCYVLESTAKDSKAKYPRFVSWVDADAFVVLKGEVFDGAGASAKRFRAENLEKVDGIWTIHLVTVENVKQGTRTILRTTRAEYNRGLAVELFTRQALERGGL